MGWRTVMVTQHAKVSYSMNRIIIQTNQETYPIPIDDIQTLLIATTQVVITTAAISELARQDVKMIFTGKDGQPICETNNYYSSKRDGDKLTKQFNWPKDRQEELWTQVVGLKLTNQINVLKLLKIDAGTLETELDQFKFNDITNREAVVARKYFTKLFEQKFSRQDDNATNAALNYGYSILLSSINREIVINGCLTQIGIHHYNQENEFNLGSDLMEPFRPLVDIWVAKQKFEELTPDIKIGLVDLLNIEIEYGHKKTILRNAITRYVQEVINYLDGDKEAINLEMELPDEVSYNAINSDV